LNRKELEESVFTVHPLLGKQGRGNKAGGRGSTSIRYTCSCSKIDAKRGNHFLQADFSGLTCTVEVGYIPLGRPTLNYAAWRLESKKNAATSTNCAFFAQVDYFWIAHNSSVGGE
jgi:hypothetical protein